MENRLKQDILSEASRCAGRVLLHREETNLVSNQSEIIGYWEMVTNADVWTPAEVYILTLRIKVTILTTDEYH